LNNLYYHSRPKQSCYDIQTDPWAKVASDWNLFYSTTGDTTWRQKYRSRASTLTDWQKCSGKDVHSVWKDPEFVHTAGSRPSNLMKSVALVSMAVLLISGWRVAGEEKPNILLIMADDLGAEALACYGNTVFTTPNMDRMATEGARFDIVRIVGLSTAASDNMSMIARLVLPTCALPSASAGFRNRPPENSSANILLMKPCCRSVYVEKAVFHS
jgi:hypothetical protein